MPVCRKCGAEITNLILYQTKWVYQIYSLDENGKVKRIRNSRDWNSLHFHCPVCRKKLFQQTNTAKAFLQKAPKTKW